MRHGVLHYLSAIFTHRKSLTQNTKSFSHVLSVETFVSEKSSGGDASGGPEKNTREVIKRLASTIFFTVNERVPSESLIWA